MKYGLLPDIVEATNSVWQLRRVNSDDPQGLRPHNPLVSMESGLSTIFQGIFTFDIIYCKDAAS